MGAFLLITDKEKRVCPKCGSSLIYALQFRNFIEWQSKDIFGEYGEYDVGDAITLRHSGILFKAEPFDAVWTGCHICLNNKCRAFIECDIIIKEGIIIKIENLRTREI